MIDISCLKKDWLETKQAELNSDPILIEKVIRALYLLEQLTASGMQFIFKGGTSLLLLLSEPHRFSIDIDILTTETQETLDGVFKNIVEDGHFIKYTEDSRGNSHELPKAHFKFFYTSVINSHYPSYVLLDILFQRNPYPEIINVPIQSGFILSKDTPIQVVVPSLNSILGDKLTAYAPNTTGILYGMSKELEIIKQLYDVSHLFDVFNDFSIVKASFEETVKKEIVYRSSMQLTSSDLLNDIFQTSYIIASRGIESPEDYQELLSGIKKMKIYIH
jgi:predicted nucleotidyltransferase component of viral defense system